MYIHLLLCLGSPGRNLSHPLLGEVAHSSVLDSAGLACMGRSESVPGSGAVGGLLQKIDREVVTGACGASWVAGD